MADPIRMVHFNPHATRTIDISPLLVQHWPCPDDGCVYCSEQYRHRDDMFHQQMHYVRSLTTSEAANVCRDLTASAQRHRTVLQEKLASHGDLFMSRWKKRSKEKRAELLIRANPLLPEAPYADFFEFTQIGDWQNWRLARNPKFRLGLLLPYLAVSKLKNDPALIFALMHYRTRHELEEWAAYDMYQFDTPWKTGQLDVDVSPMCAIVHGRKYGNLVPFDPDTAHRFDTIGFPRAHLLLEAQATLMEFLDRLFDLTLEGANLETTSSVKWQAMCTEGFHASGDVAQWSTYSHQPFSSPPTLDIDNIISIAQARLEAVTDHLALLQTEPAYMRRYIRTIAQAEVSRIASREGELFAVVDVAISMELKSLYWWLCVKEEAEHVRGLHRRFRDNIYPGNALPSKYDHALAALELLLVNLMNVKGYLCRYNLDQRPAFSQYTKYERTGDGEVTISRRDRGDIRSKYRTDRLYWCLQNLCAKPDAQDTIAHDQLFSFLEDLLADSPLETKSRLDQTIYDHFSDLAANHQLLLAVRLGRPRNKAGDDVYMRQTENRRAWKDDFLADAGDLKQDFGRGNLLKRFYDAPMPQGRQDSIWIERSEAIYAALSTYWSSVRKSATQHMRDEAVAKLISADLDPGHVAELERRRQVIRDNMAAQRTVPQVVFDIPATPGSSDNSSQQPVAKSKKKTRPDAAAPNDSAATKKQETIAVSPSAPAAEPNKPPIATTKRAFTIFNQIFGDGFDVPTGKDCDWDQFVHAMKDVGFQAKNSAGSAVNFDLGDRGAIVFHRPHPVPKIDHVMLKSMGRRLRKWFGWGRESFVVAGG